MEVKRFVFCPIEVNTFVLADDDGNCAVIDCGCYNRREFDTLADYIEKKGYSPKLLLNTHCHLDHIFGNGMFLEKYGLASCCHKQEEHNLVNSVSHAQFFGLEMETPPGPGLLIGDGDEVVFGSEKLKAFHVPGHSPGSLSYYSEKHSVVFTGDALFAGSIGRSDLPGGDHDLLIKSITGKLFTLPPETVVWPGHGSATTIGEEIRSNPFFN